MYCNVLRLFKETICVVLDQHENKKYKHFSIIYNCFLSIVLGLPKTAKQTRLQSFILERKRFFFFWSFIQLFDPPIIGIIFPYLTLKTFFKEIHISLMQIYI